MGLTAIVSSAASAAGSASSAASSSTSVASLTSPVGLGIGGVFVAAALIILLAYFDVLDATEGAEPSAEQRTAGSPGRC